ncbi:hypothetical protein IAQ00_13660 [Pantoea ananatis]|uniref:hypothetical protein n=1 Tax=Pantoea ananas TaxID=553 RepID=UPI00207A20BB|nr:hypothetical protein [Pantoea ananatis]USL56760.1 hypothetical protein IAQ00_13660 [Pantoea ananatis]
MNIEQLKSALMPTLTKIVLDNGTELYAHRPKLSDLDKCTTAKATLIYCITDETGYHVFSDGEESGKIDINEIDTVLANEIYSKALELWVDNSPQDEAEKK